jgi:cystathionine beta-synthase
VGRTVGEAIDLMQRYNISQLPVVDGSNGDRQVVGSIAERTLLDRVYRDPAVVTAPVSAAMDPPFTSVSADAPLDEAFTPLLNGEAAVTIIDGDRPIGMITRADLLEYVAHHR